MADSKLDILFENVTDRKSFVLFVHGLVTNFIANKDSWENWTIVDYLESLCTWVDDVEYSPENIDESFWKKLQPSL